MVMDFDWKRIELFAEMTKEEVDYLLKCSKAVLRSYEKGQEIFQENEHIKYIYVLLKGKLFVSKHYSSGRRNIFCEIHEKEIFGILIHMEPEEQYW